MGQSPTLLIALKSSTGPERNLDAKMVQYLQAVFSTLVRPPRKGEFGSKETEQSMTSTTQLNSR